MAPFTRFLTAFATPGRFSLTRPRAPAEATLGAKRPARIHPDEHGEGPVVLRKPLGKRTTAPPERLSRIRRRVGAGWRVRCSASRWDCKRDQGRRTEARSESGGAAAGSWHWRANAGLIPKVRLGTIRPGIEVLCAASGKRRSPATQAGKHRKQDKPAGVSKSVGSK